MYYVKKLKYYSSVQNLVLVSSSSVCLSKYYEIKESKKYVTLNLLFFPETNNH